MLERVLAIIGAAAGVTALLTLAYAMGFQMSALKTRVDILFTIVVDNLLANAVQAGRIAQAPFSFAVSPEVHLELASRYDPEIIEKWRGIAREYKTLPPDAEIVQRIVKVVGSERMRERCQALDLTTEEWLALSVASIQQHHAQPDCDWWTDLTTP